MKRSIAYLLFVGVVIINIYLIFYWQPQNKLSYKQKDIKETLSYSQSEDYVETGKMLEQLSSDDRKEYEKIIKKLSTFDIGKIKEYYESSNQEESINNIFRLLNKRLTTKEYEKIEKIIYSLSRFRET